MRHDFLLQRLWSDNEQTFGFFRSKDNSFKAHSLEDEARAVKVKGETRIPALTYKLGIRKEATPLTIKHRESYNKPFKQPWFEYHIEVLNVPGFSGIYIHSGIDQTHTDGCILLAKINNLSLSENPLSDSLVKIREFYKLVYPLIEKGDEVYLTIFDEDKLWS